MKFNEQYSNWLNIINASLDKYLQEKHTPEANIVTAMRYSVMAGGKRLRPVLALAVSDMLDGKMEDIIPFACAIEMIHTYSLIHDDLPAMDNDDYRRGRLTNHKVYGEAMAVLAGDALLNYAFEVMIAATLENAEIMDRKVKVMQIIAEASGSTGMIAGQIVDLESEGRAITADVLQYMHRCKTGAMIKAPVASAAVICGATADEAYSLEQFAEKIGLAFQVMDDILDVEGNSQVMGKSCGSDMANDKCTFVTLYGIERSKDMLSELTDSAISCLAYFGEKAEFLRNLAKYLLKREN